MDATPKQIAYIKILAVDLNLERSRRNARVSDIIGRKITGLDELSRLEASEVIDKFVLWKELVGDVIEETRKEED